MFRRLVRALVVMATAALAPVARYAFRQPLPESPSDEVCFYLLVGGPFDGRKEEYWAGAQQIVMNMASLACDPDSDRAWAKYRRSYPELRSTDGLIEFRFEGIQLEHFG
jgi:hypothetical protein